MRPRGPAGLRWRLLIALLGTSAITLGVAALVVLPPMQDRLRQQSADSLDEAVVAARPAFESAFANAERDKDFQRRDYLLFQPAEDLNDRTSARVLVMDDTGQALDPRTGDLGFGFLYDSDNTTEPARAADLALAAMRSGAMQERVEGDHLVVATPLTVGGKMTGALVADRELTEAAALVSQVRDRFLIAAVLGLAVAALLALALSSTLLRRLRRLRATALRITDEGPDAPTPHDQRRDEVGDLARALARMQEELRRQEAARRAFVSTASHELRTPLTMLQGTMELLEEDLREGRLDEADGLRQIEGARTELNRLSALAGELLDLSRLDAAVPLRSEPVELGEIVRAVAAEFALRAEKRGTAVDIVRPGAACWGSGAPDAIARVVRILVDNALRYGPRGEPIRLEARAHLGRAMITVADAGPGIPVEEREHIFERFHRGKASSAESGFGLGLAIGRELTERMGGRLELDPSGPGATFVLTLPAASGSSPARSPAPGSAAAA